MLQPTIHRKQQRPLYRLLTFSTHILSDLAMPSIFQVREVYGGNSTTPFPLSSELSILDRPPIFTKYDMPSAGAGKVETDHIHHGSCWPIRGRCSNPKVWDSIRIRAGRNYHEREELKLDRRELGCFALLERLDGELERHRDLESRRPKQGEERAGWNIMCGREKRGSSKTLQTVSLQPAERLTQEFLPIRLIEKASGRHLPRLEPILLTSQPLPRYPLHSILSSRSIELHLGDGPNAHLD